MDFVKKAENGMIGAAFFASIGAGVMVSAHWESAWYGVGAALIALGVGGFLANLSGGIMRLMAWMWRGGGVDV